MARNDALLPERLVRPVRQPPAGRRIAGLRSIGFANAATVVVAAAIVVGVALRAWAAASPLGTIDGDEATTGLMAREILHGHLYAYMAGQRYNGAIEQYLQAAAFAVFPQSLATLRAVELALFVVAAVLVYAVGRRLLPSRWQAAFAVVLFSVGPVFNVLKSFRSHGAYPTSQILGLLALFAVARLRGNDRDGTAPLVALGVVCGLGAWLAWSSAYLVVPAVLWAVPTWRARPRLLVPSVLGAVVGFAPALAYWASGGALPGLGGPQPPTSPFDRAAHLFGPVLREFIGVAYRYGTPGWPLVAQWLAAAALLAALAAAAWRRRRGLFDVALARAGERRPADVLLVAIPIVVVAYVASPYTWWTGQPRYLFAAYPALALGLAAMLPRRPRPRAVVSCGLAAAIGVSSVVLIGRHRDDGPRDLTGCLATVTDYLVAHDMTRVYSDYWTGMPLQFMAGDRLVVAPVGGGDTKFPYQRATVDGQPDVAYVAGHVIDPMDEETDNVALVEKTLKERGISARATPVACVTVFSDFTPSVRPWRIGLGKPLAGQR